MSNRSQEGTKVGPSRTASLGSGSSNQFASFGPHASKRNSRGSSSSQLSQEVQKQSRRTSWELDDLIQPSPTTLRPGVGPRSPLPRHGSPTVGVPGSPSPRALRPVSGGMPSPRDHPILYPSARTRSWGPAGTPDIPESEPSFSPAPAPSTLVIDSPLVVAAVQTGKELEAPEQPTSSADDGPYESKGKGKGKAS